MSNHSVAGCEVMSDDPQHPSRWRSSTATVVLLLSVACLVGCGEERNAERSRATETERTPVSPRSQREPPPPTPESSELPAAAPPPKDFTTYSTSLYSVDVPSDWTLVKDEVENEGFVRSQWRDPADPNTSLSIDTGEEETPPESKAETVRADTRQDPAYQELSFAPRLISGMTGQKWMFRLGDDQRVDYFVNDCGMGLAVLGSTSAVRFAALEDTFSQVAQSLELTCEPSSPSEDCDPSYPTVCIPSPPPQLRCEEVDESEFKVRGDDPHRFDRDGDGEGCEQYGR